MFAPRNEKSILRIRSLKSRISGGRCPDPWLSGAVHPMRVFGFNIGAQRCWLMRSTSRFTSPRELPCSCAEAQFWLRYCST